MMVDFSNYFWGEKNNGFEVLYHNMKYGLVASKELAEFLRERSNIEEYNSKLLGKLAKQAGSGCVQGTFAPVWQILRTTAEKLACLHLQMVQKVSDLVKEVTKYTDELHKKHKSVKEEECGTLEIAQSIQSTSLTLQKAKDTYTQKGIELDKLKKENASPKDLEKAEIKLKKAQEDYKTLIDKYSTVKEEFENKMSFACKHFQEVEESHLKQMKEFLNTYAELVENNHHLIGRVHIEFKRQCLEMTVDKLLEQFVLNKYTGLEKPGSIEFEEVNITVGAMDGQGDTKPALAIAGTNNVETKPLKREGNASQWEPKGAKQSRRTTSLLNLFMSNSQGAQGIKDAGAGLAKGGGSTHPTSAPTSPISSTTVSTSATPLTRNPLRGSKWVESRESPSPTMSITAWTTGFLRSRREKRKEKKAKKKKEGSQDNTSNKDEKSDVEEKEEGRKSKTPTPEVDEEGYCIRPKMDIWDNDKGSFYSSSDTDSDDDREHKIHVEIKPLSNGTAPMSASVDELRATVENISLSPLGTASGSRGSNTDSEHQMKRSQSVSQQIGGKLSSDLVGLNMFPSPTGSSASTPTASHPYAPLQSPTLTSANSPAPSNKYTDLGDLFSEVGEIQPALPPKQSRQTSTPTSGIIIPRPPSRRGEVTSTSNSTGLKGRMSPGLNPIVRADSVGSLEFRAAGVPVGSSRGPSPLTIGMADTIPLAVAFHEIVHCYFRGTDETKCQVKLSGDMMVSFPAGIVAVLANNPNPAQLSFRIRHSTRLDNILPNKQLINWDNGQSTQDCCVFDFNMSALTALLRRQSEQNPSASYFNVDILKYQIKAKSGAGSCPFQLVAYWKCEPTQTDLKIDYKYNSHAMASPSPLLNLTVAVPVDGGVKNIQSKPSAQWLTDSGRAVWKFTELSQHSENHGVGSLRARLEVTNGPSNQGTIAAQFNCEGTTLSGVEFDLTGSGYRLSLVKRRFVSGKYICDGDSDPKYRYAAPPPTSSSEC